VSNVPGAIVQTRMHDAALRGRVGGLADLAVEGGDRGGHDHGAALAVLARLVPRHRGCGEPKHVEGPDQVHAHDRLERLQVGRTVLAHGALRPSDARA
jgi:hypothetical protein